MKYWIDEQTGCKMCEPNCVDEWLQFIWDIGCDYDGYHDANNLKQLIDELVDASIQARECLHKGELFAKEWSLVSLNTRIIQMDHYYLQVWRRL